VSGGWFFENQVFFAADRSIAQGWSGFLENVKNNKLG